MHTTTTPRIDTSDPAHNTYAMALLEALVEAMGAQADGSALVQVPGHDASTSPWLLTEPTGTAQPRGWQLARRTENGSWADVLWFHHNIDAAAALMRTYDETRPPGLPLAPWWEPVEAARPAALAA